MLDAIFTQELRTAIFLECLGGLLGNQVTSLLSEEGARVDDLLWLLLALMRVD